MGLLSWFKRSSKLESKSASSSMKPETTPPSEIHSMNGAVEVPRQPPKNVTVFEFGSVSATADKVTLAGFCPVSDDLEPCRWEIIPASESDAPQFRVVF